MLSDTERARLSVSAQSGETGLGIEFMRHLASTGRIEEIAEVIQIFYDSAQINKSPLRAFLAARVPGILVNHYFPGSTNYQQFIRWSLDDPTWADRITNATQSPQRLASEVTRIRQEVEAGFHAPVAQT